MKARDLNGRFIRTVPDKQCLHCGDSYYNPSKRSKYCGIECYYEIKRKRKDRVHWTEEMRKRLRESKLGPKNPQWKGGVTKERLKAINTMEYKAWRKSVFERDNYTCQKCDKRGGTLNADHVVPWWKDESKRFSLDNGQTLCATCHLEKTKKEMKQNWINQYASSCGRYHGI